MPASPMRKDVSRIDILGVNMADLPLRIDGPGSYAVAMVIGPTASRLDHFGARRLHIARVVGAAALQQHRPAIPLPGQVEPRQRASTDRSLHMGLSPALAAIGGDFHFRDLA